MCIFQPLHYFRRIARIIGKMVNVCFTMKLYAVEAGLVDRYLVPVSMQAPKDTKKEDEVKTVGVKKKESFVFDLNYYLIKKKV